MWLMRGVAVVIGAPGGSRPRSAAAYAGDESRAACLADLMSSPRGTRAVSARSAWP
jgi:hypothetical protein